MIIPAQPFRSFLLLILALSVSMFTSCSDDDASPSQDNLPDYTVMLYGCGGGNLDRFFIENMKQCVSHGKTDNMNMTFLFKMSKSLKDTVDVGTMKGTVRFVLGEKQDPANFNLYSYPTQQIGDDSYPLYRSESLTNFIKWNVQNYPAKNYILVLWNHGGGWSPLRDTLTVQKSILYDDNVKYKSLSLEQLTKGVKDSGIHLKAILSDACEMGLYETLGDYADVADFFIGSAEPEPDLGTRYDWVLNAISSSAGSDELFWKNITAYTDSLTDYWVKYCPLNPYYEEEDELSDMGIVNLQKLHLAYPIIKDFAAELVSSDSLYHDAYRSFTPVPYFTGESFYDSKVYFEKLYEVSGNPRLGALLEKYEAILPEICHVSVAHPAYELTPRTITIGLLLTNKENYVNTRMSQSYEYLNFDQATKWSSWLKIR